jgi:hypothetical protein
MSIAVFLLICAAGFALVMLTAWILFKANDGFDMQETRERALREAIDATLSNQGSSSNGQ